MKQVEAIIGPIKPAPFSFDGFGEDMLSVARNYPSRVGTRINISASNEVYQLKIVNNRLVEWHLK